MNWVFSSHCRRIELDPAEAALLIPILDIARDLIDKAYENRLEALDIKKISWFKMTREILKDSIDLNLECVIEVYIGTIDETKIIRDLLFDVLPYYDEFKKDTYLSIALKFDKAFQYQYKALNGAENR